MIRNHKLTEGTTLISRSRSTSIFPIIRKRQFSLTAPLLWINSIAHSTITQKKPPPTGHRVTASEYNLIVEQRVVKTHFNCKFHVFVNKYLYAPRAALHCKD